MNYKRKYKEALGKAIAMYNMHDVTGDVAEQNWLSNLFPELKESEDELTWLTKYIEEEAYSLSMDIRDNEDRIKLKKLQKSLAWLEKQGGITKLSEEEQNRFAKGVLTSCALSFINYLDAHKYESKMCVSNEECEDIENAFHNAMWDRLHRYYCKYIEKQGEQKLAPALDIEIPFGAKDSELQEVSYYIPKGFHAEIKDDEVVIKKGEQNPAWSEEDEAGLGDALWAIQRARAIAKDENDMGNLWYAENWLKSLKDRVQSQPKQEWNEEDEKKLNRIYMLLAEAADEHAFSTTCRLIGDKECVDLQDFLKSLKPQNTWKPSESDILLLERIANGKSNPQDFQASLSGLIWQLKKLREE